MTSPAHAPRRLRPAAGLSAAFAAALLAAAPAQAETGAGSALKNTAIAGTIATWTIAALRGAPFLGCLENGDAAHPGWGGRVSAAKDAELTQQSVGLERHECKLTEVGGFALDMSPLVSASAWQAKSDSAYSHSAWDVEFTPMMHWRAPVSGGMRLDLEFGIGPSYLSEASIGNRQKSTNFQFSDHFGVGLSSADGHWRAGFAFRHISNLSIRMPNNAVDFKGVALEWTP